MFLVSMTSYQESPFNITHNFAPLANALGHTIVKWTGKRWQQDNDFITTSPGYAKSHLLKMKEDIHQHVTLTEQQMLAIEEEVSKTSQ